MADNEDDLVDYDEEEVRTLRRKAQNGIGIGSKDSGDLARGAGSLFAKRLALLSLDLP